MTRPEPTIYGNCESWDFIVGKKPALNSLEIGKLLPPAPRGKPLGQGLAGASSALAHTPGYKIHNNKNTGKALKC
jgi:hypothetical protein